ncbi:MAG: Flp family type IVb pilin [Terracidiphilus sp.]
MNNLLLRIYLRIQNLRSDETGQDLIEYALVAAMIAVVAVAMLRKVGTAVNTVFSNISSGLA